MKIEHSLSKDKISSCINQIYLSARPAEAAARACWQADAQLSLAEFAMLAGLPKAPSRYNPVVISARQGASEYVRGGCARSSSSISRPAGCGQTETGDPPGAPAGPTSLPITPLKWCARRCSKSTAKPFTARATRSSPPRRNGLPPTAVWQGVPILTSAMAIGAGKQVSLPADKAQREAAIASALEDLAPVSDMQPAVVVGANAKLIRAQLRDGTVVDISGNSLKWVANWIASKKGRQLAPGAVVRVQAVGSKPQWRLAQLPEVEAALVSLHPKDGAITALVGGFDFNRNKFNRVTQAWRQPGSSFKPFIYSAALEKGYTLATTVEDAACWPPKPAAPPGTANYDGSNSGPAHAHRADKSLNLVSVRILQDRPATRATTFAVFDLARHPPYHHGASSSVTPLQLPRPWRVRQRRLQRCVTVDKAT
jgi:penicillin-binding protein 1A